MKQGLGDRLSARCWWIVLALVAVAMLGLLAMGRSPICPCGTVRLWRGSVQSDENSQQLTDWYSLSHVIHGFLFYGGGRPLLRRWDWRARLTVATAIEAAWEVLENSPLIIDRYRTATMALGYTGDSIVNSVADIGCMVLGFAVARRLPWWVTVMVAIMFELLTLAIIRDNLTLNILMLIAPVDAIRAWQAG